MKIKTLFLAVDFKKYNVILKTPLSNKIHITNVAAPKIRIQSHNIILDWWSRLELIPAYHNSIPTRHISYRCLLRQTVKARDANPGVGARHPPGTPPRGGVWGWGIEHSKPRVSSCRPLRGHIILLNKSVVF